nr:MAG TPA: hypothetical protein [Caudoviricetes sp.]
MLGTPKGQSAAKSLFFFKETFNDYPLAHALKISNRSTA